MALSANAKKTLTLIVVAFALFFLFTQPERAAELVVSLFELLQEAAQAIITFFEELT